MRRVTVGIGPLVIAAIAACGGNDGTGVEVEVFGAFMVGDDEVPPVETDALGQVSFETDGTTVVYDLIVAQIVEVTAAHIHEGGVDENGPVLRTLFTADPPETVDDTARLALESFTAPDEGAGITLTELLDLMRTGDAYVNVHTTDNPGGEIRGQIELFE